MSDESEQFCGCCGTQIDNENPVAATLCPQCDGQMCDACYPGFNTICMVCEEDQDSTDD